MSDADPGRVVATVPDRPPGEGRRPRGWSLETLPAVRRRLARIVSDLDAGRAVDVQRSRAVIYGLSIIAMILKAEAEIRIEERVLALEEKLGAAQGVN